MTSFNVTVTGSARLNAQLDAFARNIKGRQAMARKLAGYVRTQARRNIRRQETVEGAPFAPRQRRREARAMLMGLAKSMTLETHARDGGGYAVTWSNTLTAKIADRHQRGIGEDWNPAHAEKVYGSPDYAAPCTRKQAQELLREGYRLMVPAKGGGRRPKRVTVLWLQRHFTIGHAGLVLRFMRTKNPKGAQTWQDTVPARPFLGVTAAEADKMCLQLAKSVLGPLANN